MEITIVVIVMAVVLAANLLAGPGSKLRARWEEYSDRQLLQRTGGIAKEQPDKPVTGRYLAAMVTFYVVGMVFYIWLRSDKGWAESDTFATAVFFLLLVLPGLAQLIKEYRKPGHGSRYRRQPLRDPSPDPDGW